MIELARNLKIRWKLLAVVLPLVLVPVVVVGSVVGYIANEQAIRGINQTSKDDLVHMAQFSLDLLNAHHQQFQVYKEDKKAIVHRDLASLVNFAHSLVEAQQHQHAGGIIGLKSAREEARDALKRVNLGDTGYIYAIASDGTLVAHLAREGENIIDETDEDGRPFIRDMIRQALAAPPGEVLFTVYPWRNEILGDREPRRKVVAYRYFAPWDWIVAAGSYLDETYEDDAFERSAFADLKHRLQSKRVGHTGYIYAMTTGGELTVHPFREGQDIYDEQDDAGRFFIREMCEQKSGWIRYPWKNVGDAAPRMKVVRYEYFEPWDWVVAVGSYEDEFYGEARKISTRIFANMLALTIAVGVIASGLVIYASKVLTDPIRRLREGILRVKGGNFGERLEIRSGDELGELADAFNRMIDVLEQHQRLEKEISQHGKLASLGVLSSGVAHEINNPLGVILGFAGYLEKKVAPEDPNYQFICDIKRESHRCRKIVQDLLSYARIPKPSLRPADLNALLGETLDFAGNQAALKGTEVVREFEPRLPLLPLDANQIRQVIVSVVLNAAAALAGGGRLTVRTRWSGGGYANMEFEDTGPGIAEEDLDQVCEPFYSTKEDGTGLGLAIARQILERHHGDLRIESQQGVGTRVTASLPMSHEEF